MDDISKQLDNLPDYGQLQIFVKAHHRGVSKVDTVKMTTTRYEDQDPNISVTADIIRMIKLIQATESTGTLGFSVSFKTGQAVMLQVQDFKGM